ncbi:MAG: Trm112 family protein [Candidatus Acidiferrales bacterium]
MLVDPELLARLVCPVCRKSVQQMIDREALRCKTCRRIYPIRDGFPVMLPDEAEIDDTAQ